MISVLIRTIFLINLAILLDSCNDPIGLGEPLADGECFLSTEHSTIVDQLSNTYAYPLLGADPDLVGTDLDPLIDYIGDAHFVGLGEATHGTSEFFKAKDRIFRALVEEKDFKAIIFEIPWGQALVVNDYVTFGLGNLDDAINQTYYWVYDTGEVRDLAEWIRQKNTAIDGTDKIYFVGCDPQSGDFKIEKQLVIDYIKKVQEDSLTFALLNYSNLPLDLRDYNDAPPDFKEKNRKGTAAMYEFMEANRDKFIEASSEYEYEVNLMAAHVIQHRELMYRIDSYGVTRDSLMAIYSEWWQRILGNDEKVAIWAHNAHVMNGAYFNAEWMGTFLKRRHGDDYRNVAFSFGTGSFNAFLANRLGQFAGAVRTQFVSNPPCRTTNHLLTQVEGDQHYLLFHELSGESRTYFEEPQSFLQLGAGFNVAYIDRYRQSRSLSRMYDALIHFDKTTSSDLQ